MKWLDQAGYVCASAWSGLYCVTAFVGDINFHHPISVGDLIEVTAKIIYTGKTSIHITIDLRSCRPQKCELSKAIHCIMVFVAVDENNKPVIVPSWNPIEESDIILEKYAIRIMGLRQQNQKDLAAIRW